MAVYGGDYAYAARKGGDGDDIPWDEPLELRNILNASAVVKITKWKDVGLELGVEKHVLEIIDQDCRGITNDCKREMFSHWLENDCQPSWDKVNCAVNLVRNRLEEGSRLEEIIKSLKSDVNSLGRFDEAEKQDLIRQLTELTNKMRKCTAPIDDCDQAPHEEEKNFRDFQLHLTWLIQYFMQVSEGALQRYVEQLKQRKSKSSYYWLIMLATTWLVQGLLIGIAVLISFQSGTIIFLIMVTLIILVATNEIYESRKENSNLEINQKLDNDTKIEKAMKHKFKQVKKTVECQFTKNECPIQYPPSDSSPHSPSKPSSPPSSNHTFHTSADDSSHPSADDSSHPSAGHPPSSSNSSQPFTNCCFCSTTDPLSYPSSENCSHSSSGNFSHPSSDAPSHSSSDPPSHSSSDPPSHPSSDPPAHPSSDPSSQPSSQPSSDSSHPFSDPPSDPFLDTPFPSFSDPLFSPFSDPPFPSLSNPLFRPSHHFSCDSSHPSSDSSHPSSDSSHPFSDPPSHPSLDPLSHSSSDPPSQPSSDPPSQPSSDPPSQPSSDPPSQPSSDPPSQPSSDPLSQPSLESSSHPFSDPPAHPFTDTPLPSFSDPLFSHFSDPPFCPSPIPPPSHSSSCNSFHSSSCSSSHSSSSNSSHSSSSNSSQSSSSNSSSGILDGVFHGLSPLIYKYLDIYSVLVLALIFCILIIIYYVAYKRLCNRN